MACCTEETCSLFLAPFPGTLCINYFQTERIGQGWSETAGIRVLIVHSMCVTGWMIQLQSRSEEGRGAFLMQLPGDLSRQRCLSAAVCHLPRCVHQSKPGDKLFLGVARMDRHARASPGMLHGAISSTSLLSPSAGVLQRLSPGSHGRQGHGVGEVLCVQGVTSVDNAFCLNS